MSQSSTTPPGNVLFASNDVTVAIDATLRGSLSIPGKPSPAKVLLITAGPQIGLYISLDTSLKLPPAVAVFNILDGYKGTVLPNENSWVAAPLSFSQDVDKATHGHDDSLEINSVLRLTFKSPASLWAFAYYTGGINWSLPRSSDTGLTYGITLEGGHYESLISGETVIEYPAMPA